MSTLVRYAMVADGKGGGTFYLLYDAPSGRFHTGAGMPAHDAPPKLYYDPIEFTEDDIAALDRFDLVNPRCVTVEVTVKL